MSDSNQGDQTDHGRMCFNLESCIYWIKCIKCGPEKQPSLCSPPASPGAVLKFWLLLLGPMFQISAPVVLSRVTLLPLKGRKRVRRWWWLLAELGQLAGLSSLEAGGWSQFHGAVLKADCVSVWHLSSSGWFKSNTGTKLSVHVWYLPKKQEKAQSGWCRTDTAQMGHQPSVHTWIF